MPIIQRRAPKQKTRSILTHTDCHNIKQVEESLFATVIDWISQNRVQVRVQFQLQNQNNETKLGCIFQQQLRSNQNMGFIEFVIVLHQNYPWSAPFAICSSQTMFPRLDDYRDYLEDILGAEWWPSITLTQIIAKTEVFVEERITNRQFAIDSPFLRNYEINSNLVSSVLKTSFDLGKRHCPDSIVHSLECISRNCKGLTLCTGQYYNTEQGWIGKYEKIALGLSWSYIILFKQVKQNEVIPQNSDQTNANYTIISKWPIRQIKRISSKKSTIIHKGKAKKPDLRINSTDNNQSKKPILNQVQQYQFCFKFLNGKQQYIRIQIEQQKIEKLNEQIAVSQQIINNDSNVSQNKLKQVHDHDSTKRKLNIEQFTQGKNIINLQYDEEIRESMKGKPKQTSKVHQLKRIKSRKCKHSHQPMIFQESNMKLEQSKQQLENKRQKRMNELVIQVKQHEMTQANKPTKVPVRNKPLLDNKRGVQRFRHIIQYIQLRQCVLSGDQCFQTRVRMLSQIIQNVSELEEQVQLQLYYQWKLKQIIASEYALAHQSDAITSKFQFDI